MTGTDAINYYHSLEKFGIKPGLERISVLLSELGNPQDKLKFFHIAGTNGKGTVCTEIASILRESGYKTGLYTSPYILDFRERVQINNELISPEDLANVTQRVKTSIDLLNSKGIEITEFEAITAAAFLYFLENNCDIVVLETGLGGRFDATNVIKDCLCSVITSVSLDHTAILGNSISEIAFEKCGIIKPGCPVVTTDSQEEEFYPVIYSVCNNNESPLFISDSTFCEIKDITNKGTLIEYKNISVNIPFAGRHQIENAILAISAVSTITDDYPAVTLQNIKHGLEKSFIPARCEIISDKPFVMLDGSHNPGSTKALSDYLSCFFTDKKLIGLCAMMKDKACEENFRNLSRHFDEIVFSDCSNPRSESPENLSKVIQSKTKTTVIHDNISAIEYIKSAISNYDGLIVFGSLYFASDIREILLKEFR